jgi:hypothetical protein
MRSGIAICALVVAITGDVAIAQDPSEYQLDSISIDGVERRWRMFVPDQYEEGVA